MAGTPGTPSQAWYNNAALPAELQTWHPLPTGTDVLDGAQLTYFSAWSAVATTPQYAYIGEAIMHKSTGGNLGFYKVRFIGYVANASVSTTPVPKVLSQGPTDLFEMTPGYASIVSTNTITMPAELVNFTPFPGVQGPTVAQVVYTANWNPAGTTPQAAYYFTCWTQSANTPFAMLKYSGVGWVANASVSTTPVPRLWDSFGCLGTGTGGLQQYATYSHQGSEVNIVGEDVNGNGAIGVCSSLGTETVVLESSAQLDTAGKSTGGQVRVYTSLGAGGVNPLAAFPITSVSSSAQ